MSRRSSWLIPGLGLLLLSSSSLANAVPSLGGCTLFPANNVWNTPVEALPVDPRSAAYINSIGASVGLHPDFGSGTWDGGPIGIPFITVPITQPGVSVSFEYADESDPGPYPIPANAPIEGGPDAEGDRHVLVLERTACQLYELYSAYPQAGGTWDAVSGAIFDLNGHQLRPRTWTSADAAGLPILPGLVRYEEVAAGAIEHALRFTVPQTRRAFVWPARHYASSLTGLEYPPMGQRFRLKASFDIQPFPVAVQVILRALKKYGMIVADNGSPWYITGVPDERWDNEVLHVLDQVKGSSFEAVDASGLMINPDSGQASLSRSINLNASPPPQSTRLIFVHHSTGENLLADDNGGLGIALKNNRYFTSDTNYGWGPNGIGDLTDIGHWWLWFRGPQSASILNALYAESGQNAFYSRLPVAPAGPNRIVLFKSCFPNSALPGNPLAPVPPIASNPLKGQDSGSPAHTLANAKGIYLSLLDYFRTRQDKLFIVLAAPPLTDPTYSANARIFNQWLTTDWLKNYPYHNVAVFDFYNTLTTNGGNPNLNDLGKATGNHHRLLTGVIQHKTDGDNDPNPNVLEYPSGDDHPSRAGNLKAVAELLPWLNVQYHCWQGTGGCSTASPSATTARAISATQVVVSWQDNSLDEGQFLIERKPGECTVAGTWTQIAAVARNTRVFTQAGLAANTPYAYRVRASNGRGNSDYSPCASARTGMAGTPNAPAGLAATALSSSAIRLAWTDQSSNETGFRLYRKAGAAAWVLLKNLGANQTAYIDATAVGNPST